MASLKIPTFSEPEFPSVSPHEEQIEAYTRDYAERVGMTATPAGRRRLDAGYGRFVAWTYPAAPFEDLGICAEWLFVTFVLDDLHTLPAYDSPDAWSPHHRRLMTLIETGRHEQVTRPTAFTRSVADLSERTRRKVSAAFYERFAHHLDMFFQGFSRESENRRIGTIPELGNFLETRRLSVGMEFGFDLVEFSQGFEVPEAVYTSPGYQSLVAAAADIVAWQNDVHSLKLDIQRGDLHNLVLVQQKATGSDLDQAREMACDQIRQRIDDFTSAEHRLLAALAETDLTEPDQARILDVVAGMRQWANGCLHWYRTTTRYTIPASSAEADREHQHLEAIF
ncbi:hypothetical protein RKE29_05030 [Streptomyces sp. B1866]|uniref:terpene synthase family protein n=1 Tax=Streptomyces sp. B1866 TaxID=3075431 RepID=UPI0028925BFE|nr:hypothetical protein [Streptomyces sp. B1866]MDT3396012.1 hypothetical protein [Streptomyces sp. B1866]